MRLGLDRFLTGFVVSVVLMATLAGLSVVAAAEPRVTAAAAPRGVCPTDQIWQQRKLELGLGLGKQACLGEGPCDDPTTRDAVNQDPLTVRVLVHVMRSSTGELPNDVSQSSVDAQMEKMQADFAPYAIQFDVVGTRWHNDDTFHCTRAWSPFNSNWFADIQAMKNAYAESPSTQINIFIGCQAPSIFGTLFGIGTFPWDPVALTNEGGLWLNAEFVGAENTVAAHEMGHNLGLWHTHRGVTEVEDCLASCVENQHPFDDGAADLVGDFCKDTPATPQNASCSSVPGTDCNGVDWGYTMPENFMGFGPSECRDSFTPQQIRRIHCWARDLLGDAVTVDDGNPVAPTAQFSAWPTAGPPPLTVHFTNETKGDITAWAWNFGDGQGSGANDPAHTYDQPGSYTVSLSAIGPAGFDTKVMSQLVHVTEPPMGEATIGSINAVVHGQVGGEWYTANFDRSYTNPVVVMKCPGFFAGQPVHLRARSVTSIGFEWQLEEWDYQDGNHGEEEIPFLVLEAGEHDLTDGTRVEAQVALVGVSWTTVQFSQPFASPPVLLTGVMSNNDEAAIVTRTRNLSGNSFEVRLQEEEAADGIHVNEKVGWFAIEAGTGTNDGRMFEAGRTPSEVTSVWHPIDFVSNFDASPILLTGNNTINDTDPGSARYRNLNAAGVDVVVQEELSADGEFNHGPESFSYLVWGGPGRIRGVTGRRRSTDPSTVSRTETSAFGKQAGAGAPVFWTHNVPNPFNPTTTISFHLPAAGSTSLRIFDVSGRLISTLVAEPLAAGTHRYRWSGVDDRGRSVASGVYLYEVRSGEYRQLRRMTLVK